MWSGCDDDPPLRGDDRQQRGALHLRSVCLSGQWTWRKTTSAYYTTDVDVDRPPPLPSPLPCLPLSRERRGKRASERASWSEGFSLGISSIVAGRSVRSLRSLLTEGGGEGRGPPAGSCGRVGEVSEANERVSGLQTGRGRTDGRPDERRAGCA